MSSKSDKARAIERAVDVAESDEIIRELGIGPRPKTRGECPTIRPCPWVGCRYNIAVDIRWRTTVVETDCGERNCALDIADEGEHSLEDIGRAMGGISRERVRQIEEGAIAKLRAAGISPDMLARDHDAERWHAWDLVKPVGFVVGSSAHEGAKVTSAMLKVRASRQPARAASPESARQAMRDLAAHPKTAHMVGSGHE